MSEQKSIEQVKPEDYEVMDYDFLTFNFCENWFHKTNKKALFMKGVTPLDTKDINRLYMPGNYKEFPRFDPGYKFNDCGCAMRYKASLGEETAKALFEQLYSEHGLKEPSQLQDTEQPEIQGKFEDVLKEIFKPNQEGCHDPFDNVRKHKDIFLEPLKKQRSLLFTFDQDALKDTSFEWLLSGPTCSPNQVTFSMKDWFRAYYEMINYTLGLQVNTLFGYCIVYRDRDNDYAKNRLQLACMQLGIRNENSDEMKLLIDRVTKMFQLRVKYMNWKKNSSQSFEDAFTAIEKENLAEIKSSLAEAIESFDLTTHND